MADERRVRDSASQSATSGARRMMQRLDDPGSPTAGRTARDIGSVHRLVVDDVEVGGPLDRGGDVDHLAQLPRPACDSSRRSRARTSRAARPRCATSPVAKSVTWWPAATRPSVSSDVMNSAGARRSGGMSGDRADLRDAQRTGDRHATCDQPWSAHGRVEAVARAISVASRVVRRSRGRCDRDRRARLQASRKASSPSPCGRCALHPVSCTSAGRPAARIALRAVAEPSGARDT